MWINVTTIGDLLDQRAESSRRNALVMPDVRLTYQQLSAASDDVAVGLLGLGIGRGDKVGILMPNSHVYVEALFAIAKLGAIAENVYPAEVEHVLMGHDGVGDVAVIGVPHEDVGRIGESYRRARVRGLCERGRVDSVRPRAPGWLQASQVNRFHHRTAPQPQRQDTQTSTAGTVLGECRTPHRLMGRDWRPRAARRILRDVPGRVGRRPDPFGNVSR